ncbi:T9SS type A sorting domain-containing protein [Crocinitomix catalasitica]|nr:T9SS type A sorting domain-containing protein [Crocinitomix catalasitica]
MNLLLLNLLLFVGIQAFAQPINVYTYELTPALGPFAPTSLPPIGTVFTGIDSWGLPWFAGAPLTSTAPVFSSTGTTSSSTITDQVIMEKVINFCGHTNIQFRINSFTEQDLSWLFVSPNSNPILAVEVLGLASTFIETIPASAPISPQGGIFIRAYLSDDTDDASFGVEWMSTEQAFWSPLLDGDFTTLNSYASTQADSVICIGDSTMISLVNSDLGVSYVLRDDADDSVVDGPLQGVGGPLGFNTGAVNVETTYNVYSLGEDDALYFDGLDDHVLIPNLPAYDLTDGTIEVLLRPASISATQTFLAFENPTGTFRRYSFHLLTDLTGIGFDNGTTIETIATAVSADAWQTFSFVDNGTDTEAFIDGVSVGTFPSQFGTASDPSMNLILGTNGTETEPYKGDIEEVRVYNTVKSSTEISDDLDSCLMGSENGLVAFFNFEDSYGSTTVQDITINGNDGVLTNMDEFVNWVASTPLTCASCDVQMVGLYTVYLPYAFQTIEICDSDSSFLQSAWQTSAGIYFDTLVSVALGCDSIVETTLIVNPTYANMEPIINICSGDSSLIFGTYELASGTFYDSLLTTKGCDSIIIQDLIVNPIYFTVMPDAFICPFDSVLVFGAYEFFPGTYYDSLLTIAGCDSIFEQTVNPSSNPPVGILEYSSTPICEQGGPILLPLASPSGGVYSGTGVSGGFFDPTGLSAGTYTTTYTYTNSHGCSSSDSVTINVVDCLGVEDLGESQQIKVFPNPSNGNFTVEFTEFDSDLEIEIFNSLGQKIHHQVVQYLKEDISLFNVESGMYLLKVSSPNGQAYRQIIIE